MIIELFTPQSDRARTKAGKRDFMTTTLTPDMLVAAYAGGIFPMAEHRGDTELFWVDPRQRGVLPLDAFHISRSLAKTLRSDRFRITFDADFAGVVTGCANREETWINDILATLYGQLHLTRLARSIEVWDGDDLVGGVFGITLGGAFFGESMFSKLPNASKIALVHLIERLKVGKFAILDTQFITEHLKTFGAYEINQADFLVILKKALMIESNFFSIGNAGELNIELYPKADNFN